jgi:hypothetical protein
MRWNALAQPTFEHHFEHRFEHEAAAPLQRPDRWWLGWLQLLCAWVLCMLLCANIALVFAEGLPQVAGVFSSGKPVGCAATGSPAQHGPARVERAGPVKGQTSPC